MKTILLSADGLLSVYSVPEIVADNLDEYCSEFCNKWLLESPHAEKYRVGVGVCYDERDFIQYLNEWILPDSPSNFVETLDNVWVGSEIPEKYKNCAWFNF